MFFGFYTSLLVVLWMTVVVEALGPVLISFSLDMQTGSISLTWSEPMDTAKANCNLSELTLGTADRIIAGTTVSLSKTWKATGYGDPLVSVNAQVLQFFICPEDLDALKLGGIGKKPTITNPLTAWLYLTAGAFQSATGVPCEPVIGREVNGKIGLFASLVTPDTTPPSLIRFIIDRSATGTSTSSVTFSSIRGGLMYMFFDECVSVSMIQDAVQNKQFVLSDVNNVVPQYILQCGTVVTTPYKYVRGIAVALDTLCTGSASSDWSNMSALGLLDTSVIIQLSVAAGFTQDTVPLPANEVLQLVEVRPDCQACAAGQYIVTSCTGASDKVCSPCSTTCPLNHFIANTCINGANIACQECSSCPFGYYSSTLCNGIVDTDCSACTLCNDDMEYVLTECTREKDAMCGSCMTCPTRLELQLDVTSERCNSPAAKDWRNLHCCRDTDDKSVPCLQAAIRQNEITARESVRSA